MRTLQGMIEETRAAQAARGLGRNPLALALPLTIRALRLADRVAEAVEAGGDLARRPDHHRCNREQEDPQ